ncbi:MAG: hypothetical protein ACQERN_13460 [Thermodesulfobacteriota bacterium]
MGYIITGILIAAVAFFLFRRQASTASDENKIEATYVCDQCGEHECICHKTEE